MFLYIVYCFIIIVKMVLSQKGVNMPPLKACPRVNCDVLVNVDQLLGNWHLALIIMDDTGEEYEERSMCVQGKIIKTNSTSLVQIWTVDIPEILHQRNSEIDFPTEIITPGIWIVQSPLGGELKGIVIETDGTNLIMMYCSWHEGIFAHIITVALTKERTVTPMHRLQLLSLLVRNGYDPHHNKIISWSNC